jgi:5,5'-dehydrodivanillate O-demethylase
VLSVKENERLTRVGPGTPAGELMRRYWHPIAASVELDKEPTKAVRLLGEDLVLYKDRSGALGLIGQACAHRRVNLLYGIPEQHGLRCPYHGWLYNALGQCLEQPAEAPDSTFKDRIKIPAYPAQELGGLIFAYLGPEPAPLLPRWDLFVWENVVRDIGVTMIPCNWLQAMENSMDPTHTEWLHGRFYKHIMEREGTLSALTVKDEGGARGAGDGLAETVRAHSKIGFDMFEHGIIKRRMYADQTGETPEWKNGHPVVFPAMLRVGTAFQIRVPVDDTHTWHLLYRVYAAPEGVQAPKQETIPMYDIPLQEKDGRHAVNFVLGQDFWAWSSQGPVAERHLERLGESDKGVILFRRLLGEQLEKMAEGVDPMNVFRDPARNQTVNLFQEFDPVETARFSIRPRQVGRPGSSARRGNGPALELAQAMFAEAAGASGRTAT